MKININSIPKFTYCKRDSFYRIGSIWRDTLLHNMCRKCDNRKKRGINLFFQSTLNYLQRNILFYISVELSLPARLKSQSCFENLKLNCVFSPIGESTSYRNFFACFLNIVLENIDVKFNKTISRNTVWWNVSYSKRNRKRITKLRYSKLGKSFLREIDS